MRRRWAAGAGTRGRSIGLSRKGDEQLKRGAGHPSTGPAGPGRRFAAIALIGAALLLAAVLSLGVGYYALTPLQVVQAIGSRLSILSPEAEEAMLREAGFTGISLFYAGLSFRGWVAYAA